MQVTIEFDQPLLQGNFQIIYFPITMLEHIIRIYI